MHTLKIASLLAAWVVLLLTVASVSPDPRALFDGPTLLFVGVLPLVVTAVARSPRAVWAALCHGLSSRLGDLPAETRLCSASALRCLGGITLAAGIIGIFASFVGMLNVVAATGGQGNPNELIGRIGTLLLGPLYGLALKAFLYDPLAARVEGEGGALGAALDQLD